MAANLGPVLRYFLIVLAAISLAGCNSVVVGSPEACKFEKLAELPVRFSRTQHPIVTIEIDGKRVTMLLDTGATGTVIFASALERTGLQIDRSRHGMSIGIGGLSKLDVLRATDLKLGDLSATVDAIAVGPFDMLGLGGETIDGILGFQPLGQFDIDLDLPRGRMTLYRARYCPEGMPPWDDPGRMIPRPANAPFDNRPYAPILVNGRELLGLLDSGSYSVAISRQVALAIGATEAQIMAAPKASATNASLNAVEVRRHRFESVDFLGMTARNPELDIIPLSIGLDVLIGMPILKELRIWIPVHGRKIHLSSPTLSK